MTSTPTQADRPGRREALAVIALTVVALALRIWGLGRLGLTQFDEGVYASVGAWSLSPKRGAAIDPELIAYAPPAYPILVGVAYLVVGLSDAAPLLAAIACGVATVPVAAWLGRRTFGPGAGVAAAAFAALAMAHIAFSRKALTDAPFLLVWLAALGLGMRFLERPNFGRALWLGLAVGLAQNTKYNGGLAGLIVGLTAVVAALADREARTRPALVRTFGWGLFAAGVALLAYLPWYLFVEDHGGYAALMRHHRGYLGPPATWWPHLRQQLAQVAALSGGPSWCAATWAVAWLGASLGTCGRRLVAGGGRVDWTRFRIGALFGAAVMAGVPTVGWWIGAAWSPWLLAERTPAQRLLGVAWLMMAVLTPFYHPYARLWLPLHGLGWFLLAGAVVTCGPFRTSGEVPRVAWGELLRRRAFVARCALALVCVALAVAGRGERLEPFRLAEFYRPTDDLRVVAADLAASQPWPTGQAVSLRLLARRPLAYYLALTGRISFRLVPDAAAVAAGPQGPDDWALVDDAVAPLERAMAGPGPTRAWRYGVARTWGDRRDPVTRLDVTPESAFDQARGGRGTLTLLRPLSNATPARAPGRPPIGEPSPLSLPGDSPR